MLELLELELPPAVCRPLGHLFFQGPNWDCCKPSCSWPGKASLLSGSNPVTTCDISGNPITDYNAANGCDGGKSYMCSSEAPWAVTDDLAYGYAAVNIAGGSESSWCCACYELTLTSGTAAGKKMIVQATKTGGDLGSNQFDISMPGGSVGIFNGCTAEWGAPSSGWGAQYGGISSRSACDSFPPEALKAGCYWRFDWFSGADNPTVSFKQVTCPAALTKKSGCTRVYDSSMAAPDAVTGNTVAASVAAVASSSTPVVVAPARKAAVVVAESSTPVAVAAVETQAAAVVVLSAEPVPTSAILVVFAADLIPTSASPAIVETTAAPISISTATYKKPDTKPNYCSRKPKQGSQSQGAPYA